MTDQAKYLQQWERVKRWFTRFVEISRGRQYLGYSEFNHDEIYAFFMNCYHLKDWIKNDPAAGHMRDSVESYINQTPALAICADLCNGLKHFRLDPNKPIRTNAKFGPRTDRITLGDGPATMATAFQVITDSGNYDAFKLANDCMVSWERFLQRNK